MINGDPRRNSRFGQNEVLLNVNGPSKKVSAMACQVVPQDIEIEWQHFKGAISIFHFFGKRSFNCLHIFVAIKFFSYATDLQMIFDDSIK